MFEVPVVFEDTHCAVFKFDNLMVNLLSDLEAPGLISPGIVARRETGSRFIFTIRVDDVDAVCDELARRDVTLLNGPIDQEWGRRTASFADPDGHIWEIAQEIQ